MKNDACVEVSASPAPAFPIADLNTHVGPIGLTKREYIATMALQGTIAAGHNDFTYDAIVRDAVKYADLLLEELAK